MLAVLSVYLKDLVINKWVLALAPLHALWIILSPTDQVIVYSFVVVISAAIVRYIVPFSFLLEFR